MDQVVQRNFRYFLVIIIKISHFQLIARIGLSNLPPATLVMMGLQIVVFLRFIDLPWSNLPRSAICLRADAIIGGDYQR